MLRSVEKKRLHDSTDVPSHSGGSEQSRSSSPIADDSGYNSSRDGSSDPFNISSQQNSEDADKSEYKPNKKNRELSKSVNQLEPSYHFSNSVFYYDEFNGHDLGDGKSPLRKKFNAIIKDLEENKSTSRGDIKLISGGGGIKYLRAKLSDSDRLLFTSIEHNGKNIFVILEVILNHKYDKSKFLTDKEKIKNIKIIDQSNKEVSDNASTMEIGDAPQVRWLGKFITFSAKQEEIVENAEGKYNLPLVVSGSAGSGKTSVALEKLRKIEEEFKGGKILYITQSESLIKKSKELYEYAYYDEVAKEEKTGVPEQIEFLSVHKFLKKVIKEDEKIKGKKPINRSQFFLWFNKTCERGKFKEYKKDGDKIFEEFIAVIVGRGLLGENGKDQYTKLGDRQSIFPEEKRANIYSLSEEYKKFIEESPEYYDTSFIAHEYVEKIQTNYDAVVVDEVQDLTESTLGLILKSLKDESNFLLCGDVNQVIHPSFFSVSRLKSFLHKDSGSNKRELRVCTLEKNYRNSEQVTEVGNRILHLKNYCFASEDKMTADEKEAFFMKSDTENTGNVCFVTKDKEQEMARKVPGSINWAVLVLDNEKKEEARKLFSTPLVFNIHEAKGLEFENVILYKFTSHEAYNKIWNVACPGKGEEETESTIKKIRNSFDEGKVNPSRPKDKGDKSFEECKFHINALYVGITRAMSSVYIVGDESNLLKIIKPKRTDNIDIEKEESTPEEWRDMALKLIDEGNVEQAELTARKLQNEGEKEYVQEIIGVLEAEGYSREAQEISNEVHLDKDKSEQAIAVKKESDQNLIPQKSSMGESKNPAGGARKRNRKKEREARQNQNDEDRRSKPLSEQLKNIIRGGGIKKLKGLDISQYNRQEMLDLALENSKLEVANYFIECEDPAQESSSLQIDRRSGGATLHLAAQEGYCGIARLLLQRGDDVNAEKKQGFTPLYLAVQRGHEGVVKLLLQHPKVDVNVKSEEGLIPLHVAVVEGNENVVKLLLNKSADVNSKNNKGMTPLHFAAQGGRDKVAGLLLKHGSNVNSEDERGSTPLHFAAESGKNGVVQLLLSREADVNAKSHKCATPLHLGAQNGHEGVVKLLLDKSADVNARDEKNTTPLHLAALQGHKDVVALLLGNKADVNAKNNNGTVPLALALEESRSEVVDLLLADPNINVGCIKIGCMSCKNKKDKEKFVQKLDQDNKLFKKVEEAAREVDGNKVDELLRACLEKI